ncbi:hemerythrin domain-containing protein [Flavihumibacter sp. RY-1]|uniref:Hemerythrin domain-containing protein n=1 Tax=Flavihumibacter fluminis TaxID=2909236 RepID=A0ABS9BC94_9BACT|nr:hemerythrin domain-containing protein [Flavihumibacter fluminis]MCF1713087.1 hemerythrin domain-containing protein [Flavihumibacter fluminis]
MQRAVSLQPLSRQHKSSLMTCLLIRKGVSKQASISVMADFLLKCWQQEIKPHFDQEERSLIPALRTYPEGNNYAEAILRDHELWRTAMTHLDQANVTHRLLGDLADQLEQHVRFEERIVFPSLETNLSAEQLNQLQLQDNQHSAICNTYPVKFWE